MNFRFHPEADSELREAIRYYKLRREELGREFLDEIEATIKRVRENPFQFACVEGEVRLARTNRFPYGVLFSVNDGIEILAVMHLHRRPGYWKSRL
ncbi:MAG: type II toxin-antitoxin system RelE/ParE family toxin [Pirellulaceae bacterium]|nr:type II toxin-antitoxin system RelE/ParE family toxin [Pirellulaceae bacterium]